MSATGRRTAIFDDLLLRHGLRRHALVAVTNFTAVPICSSRSDMIGVFTKLAADVFREILQAGEAAGAGRRRQDPTNMVWHARNDRDLKHAWLRQQIKAVYRDF